MKRIHIIPVLMVLLVIANGCSTSNDVVDGGMIQKRKYRKGFHFELPSPSDATNSVENATNKTSKKRTAAERKEEFNHSSNSNVKPNIEHHGLAFEKLNKKQDSKSETNPKRGDADDNPFTTSSLDKEEVGVYEDVLEPFEETSAPIAGDAKTDAIISLVAAGIWVFIFWFPIINVVFPAIGLWFAKSAIRGGEDSLGTIGRVINKIELVMSLIYTIAWVIYMSIVIYLAATGQI